MRRVIDVLGWLAALIAGLLGSLQQLVLTAALVLAVPARGS